MRPPRRRSKAARGERARLHHRRLHAGSESISDRLTQSTALRLAVGAARSLGVQTSCRPAFGHSTGSAALDGVESAETIVITRGGRRVALLMPAPRANGKAVRDALAAWRGRSLHEDGPTRPAGSTALGHSTQQSVMASHRPDSQAANSSRSADDGWGLVSSARARTLAHQCPGSCDSRAGMVSLWGWHERCTRRPIRSVGCATSSVASISSGSFVSSGRRTCRSRYAAVGRSVREESG